MTELRGHSRATTSGASQLIRVDLMSATSALTATGVGCSHSAYRKPLRLDRSRQPYIVASPTTPWVVQGSTLVLAALPPIAEDGETRITEGGIISGGAARTMEFFSIPGHPDVLSSGSEMYVHVARASGGLPAEDMSAHRTTRPGYHD